jgi:hypothetical protein
VVVAIHDDPGEEAEEAPLPRSSCREKPSSAQACASRSAESVAPRPGMAGGGRRRSTDATREEAAVAAAVGGATRKRKWCVVCL